MRPKFQKRSALKLAGRIIPEAKRSGIMYPQSGEYYTSQIALGYEIRD